jgi:hypothetical protein
MLLPPRSLERSHKTPIRHDQAFALDFLEALQNVANDPFDALDIFSPH